MFPLLEPYLPREQFKAGIGVSIATVLFLVFVWVFGRHISRPPPKVNEKPASIQAQIIDAETLQQTLERLQAAQQESRKKQPAATPTVENETSDEDGYIEDDIQPLRPPVDEALPQSQPKKKKKKTTPAQPKGKNQQPEKTKKKPEAKAEEPQRPRSRRPKTRQPRSASRKPSRRSSRRVRRR